MTDLTLSKKRNIFITEKCWGYVFLEYNPTSVNRQLTLALLLVGGLFWRKCGLAVVCRFPLIDKVEYNPVSLEKDEECCRKCVKNKRPFDSKTRMTTRMRFPQYLVVHTCEPASFWRENAMAVLILLLVLAKMSQK